MNPFQHSDLEYRPSLIASKGWAIGWLCALTVVHGWLVWLQYHRGAEDAFIVECQFCLFAILLVLGGFRLEIRWVLVLLAYPYLQLLSFLTGTYFSELFIGKQAAVFVLAMLLSVVMRLVVLPALGWRPVVPRFKLYDVMVSVTATFLWLVIWSDDLSLFWQYGLPHRSRFDVLMQITLSTSGAVAVLLPIVCISNNIKHVEFAMGLWLVILIAGVVIAGWAYTTFGGWAHPPMHIIIGNPMWTTIAIGSTLSGLMVALGKFDVELLQRRPAEVNPLQET